MTSVQVRQSGRFTGLVVAAVIVAAWAASLAWGVRTHLSLSTPAGALETAGLILLRTFLYVGLFITAHDAMHGSVVPRGPRRLGDVVGALCAFLYAGLDYAALRARHLEHHARPAQRGDPDWCADQRYLPWLWSFLRRYVDAGVICWNAAVVVALWALPGVTLAQAIALHALPAWLSVLQLFTFGTWLPHRGEHSSGDPHRARSADVPAAVSFFACYHFGYHHEHHRRPDLPWRALPGARAGR